MRRALSRCTEHRRVNKAAKHKIEFGDFQTPRELARAAVDRLAAMGAAPDAVIEPTCGLGAFVFAAARRFPRARIHGYEINAGYISALAAEVRGAGLQDRVNLHHQDFFATDWAAEIAKLTGSVLVVGNPPWVTNAGQGAIGGANLPQKSNFQGFKGFDAITGKANFDISEWMLIELVRALGERSGTLAMLVKSAVARKVVAHAERMGLEIAEAAMFGIDAKLHFGAAVDAALFVARFTGKKSSTGIDYDIFETLDSTTPKRRVGQRHGRTIGDLANFDRRAPLLGESPRKWRSGVKHDAATIMEFDSEPGGRTLRNGLGESVRIEPDYLYPLMKGSDIGSNRDWRGKFVLVTQRKPGDATGVIQERAPRTWQYLADHGDMLDARGSTIYARGPRFAVFGVGDYAFRPWRVAICGLYKKLNFRLVPPIDGKPVQFDDTVYYVSFDTRAEAERALAEIQSRAATELYAALIFWDEKRPIKASVLNVVDWSRANTPPLLE